MSWLLVVAALAVVAVAVAWFARRYAAARGARLVECPETREPAAVEIQAASAALGQGIDLSECSRWPERHACGRECLAQIERAPADCLVRNVVSKWYQGKTCAVCRRPLDAIDWIDRQPGFVDRVGIARPWPDISPEQLPDVMSANKPICFDCYVAATFRREHPELVLDNPWTRE